jgi:hypothetical protein
MHGPNEPALTTRFVAGKLSFMKLSIAADIELGAPSLRGGYVTWFDVSLADGDRVYGHARVALVHVGEIADAHGDLWPALRGTRLEGVHDVYFTQGWYKDDFADGAGIDMLYVESVELDDSVRDKNLDLALVRRLAETIGSGCQLVVLPYRTALEATHWAQIGFAVSTGGRASGYLHMKLGYRHAEVVDATGAGEFHVLSSMAPSGNVPN